MISSKSKRKAIERGVPGMKLQYQYDGDGEKVGVFIPIKEWNFIIGTVPDPAQPTKAEILTGIANAMKEVDLHRRGKAKLQDAKDFVRDMRKVLK